MGGGVRKYLHGRHTAATLAGLVLAVQSAAAADPPLGSLPSGASSTFEVREVVTEACRRHAFAPEAWAAQMPHGYRLAQLRERTKQTWIAELLNRRPDLAGHASGSLCFIDARVHTVDGSSVHRGDRSRVVFLWADMVPIAEPLSDERFLGGARRVQLFWIYDSKGVNRQLALRATPNARFGRISVDRKGAVWKLRLVTADGRLNATVRPTTERKVVKHRAYPGPGFETVPLADTGRDWFNVVTFAGHHEQLAEGTWIASGSADWARSFEKDSDAGSFIHDGWAAKVGVFPHRPR